MAITSIHPVTSTVNKCLDYIKCNKYELINDEIVRCETVTSYFNCVQGNDYEQFKKHREFYIEKGHSIRLRDDGNENLAFHLVQSFDTKLIRILVCAFVFGVSGGSFCYHRKKTGVAAWK